MTFLTGFVVGNIFMLIFMCALYFALSYQYRYDDKEYDEYEVLQIEDKNQHRTLNIITLTDIE